MLNQKIGFEADKPFPILQNFLGQLNKAEFWQWDQFFQNEKWKMFTLDIAVLLSDLFKSPFIFWEDVQTKLAPVIELLYCFNAIDDSLKQVLIYAEAIKYVSNSEGKRQWEFNFLKNDKSQYFSVVANINRGKDRPIRMGEDLNDLIVTIAQYLKEYSENSPPIYKAFYSSCLMHAIRSSQWVSSQGALGDLVRPMTAHPKVQELCINPYFMMQPKPYYSQNLNHSAPEIFQTAEKVVEEKFKDCNKPLEFNLKTIAQRIGVKKYPETYIKLLQDLRVWNDKEVLRRLLKDYAESSRIAHPNRHHREKVEEICGELNNESEGLPEILNQLPTETCGSLARRIQFFTTLRAIHYQKSLGCDLISPPSSTMS